MEAQGCRKQRRRQRAAKSCPHCIGVRASGRQSRKCFCCPPLTPNQPPTQHPTQTLYHQAPQAQADQVPHQGHQTPASKETSTSSTQVVLPIPNLSLDASMGRKLRFWALRIVGAQAICVCGHSGQFLGTGDSGLCAVWAAGQQEIEAFGL